MESTGPRTCVFKVSGYIDLLYAIIVNSSYLTVAGQTAPGDGITIRRHFSKLINNTDPCTLRLINIGGYKGDYGLEEPVRDVVIRYLRLRQGGPVKNKECPPQADTGSNIGIYGAYNVIIDHVTAGWANDNQMSMHLSGWRAMEIQNITIQKSLIHEPLVGHNTGIGMGGSGYDKTDPPKYFDLTNIDIHHNLLHSIGYRNPGATSGGTRVTNNIVYNWASSLALMSGEARLDLVNNYWRTGPSTQMSTFWRRQNRYYNITEDGYPPSVYMAGNIMDTLEETKEASWESWVLRVGPEYVAGPLPPEGRRFTPLPDSPIEVSVTSAQDAYSNILNDVGMNRRLDCEGNWVWVQDAVDQRLINEVTSRTGFGREKKNVEEAGGWPTLSSGTACPDTDNDGMPDAFEEKYGLNATNPSDNALDNDGDGYLNIEEYLNGETP
ncbi:MAG: hypothetical protein JSV63_03100 [Candidatus Aenigmatarchaeota archaeon]|nr:MAG: hypothetical protein JSV63_03100 [Candidatus Aenigmarchaeota archaeon]